MTLKEVTLKDMLRAAEVFDNGPRIEGFKISDALFRAIKRAAEIAIVQPDATPPRFIAEAILRDAGLMK